MLRCAGLAWPAVCWAGLGWVGRACAVPCYALCVLCYVLGWVALRIVGSMDWLWQEHSTATSRHAICTKLDGIL